MSIADDFRRFSFFTFLFWGMDVGVLEMRLGREVWERNGRTGWFWSSVV